MRPCKNVPQKGPLDLSQKGAYAGGDVLQSVIQSPRSSLRLEGAKGGIV